MVALNPRCPACRHHAARVSGGDQSAQPVLTCRHCCCTRDRRGGLQVTRVAVEHPVRSAEVRSSLRFNKKDSETSVARDAGQEIG